MNKKIEIDVDVSPWITEQGIEVSLFVGDDDEPTECHYTWDHLIQLLIEAEVIPSFDDKTVFLKDEDDTTVYLARIAHSLEAGAAKIYDLIDNSYIFDRDAWLKANNGEYNQENKEQFLTRVESAKA